MHLNRLTLGIMILLLLVVSCIKPYDPIIRADEAEKYVISGQVTDGDGYQTINISKTSPIGAPEFIPVGDCRATIIDANGHAFELHYLAKGDYAAWIDPVYIYEGAAFKLEILTPEGEIIQSAFDKMAETPLIESVYFEYDSLQDVESGITSIGLQFYLDFDGSELSSQNYRWEVYETWEYHAQYPLMWFYDGVVHRVDPPDYSRKICWMTKKIPDIYTLTTKNLTANRYTRFPINFVNNKSDRFLIQYSLLVNQYTLSESAYTYWDQMRTNSSQEGGLYEKQPLAVKGNLVNVTNPEIEVLGFFGVASVKSKRIFVNSPGFEPEFNSMCSPYVLERGFKELTPADYPVYLSGDEVSYSMTVLNEECINCLRLGGTNIKPDFWP